MVMEGAEVTARGTPSIGRQVGRDRTDGDACCSLGEGVSLLQLATDPSSSTTDAPLVAWLATVPGGIYLALRGKKRCVKVIVQSCVQS